LTRSRAFEAGDNFDALRLLFSACVAVFHFVLLTGAPSLAFAAAPLSIGAEIGVSGFFVLSGYLVLGSFQRSASLLAYAEKRVRRLYPAYAAVILLCALGALLFSDAARNDPGAVIRYLGANLVFLNFLAPNLPGLFDNNPLHAVNGALWTLKIEVAFYCLLPLIAIAAAKLRAGKWALFGALYIAAETWRAAFRDAGDGLAILSHQLPGQMSYFIVGMALWEARAIFSPRLLSAGICLAAIIASLVFPAFEWLRAAALGGLVIACAIAPLAPPRSSLQGDISYGLYIVHFPIIQTVHSAAASLPVWAQAGLCAGTILIAALLLWNFIERPFLHAGSHYKTRGALSGGAATHNLAPGAHSH
jgi:peptidoglycan/LPS O-acetylase OafA/YrhL